MDELEVCRLSAEALGYKWKTEPKLPLEHGGIRFYVLHKDTPKSDWIEWSPLLDAEQRWECVEWLLCRDYDIQFHTPIYSLVTKKGFLLTFECPAREVPARAVAELQRRKSGDKQ